MRQESQAKRPELLDQSNRESPARGGTGTVRISTALVVAVWAIGLAACSERLPTYRYEVQVQVDTPAGRRVGSAVTEVRSRINAGVPGPEAGGPRSELTSEAVPLQLPNGRWLFALIQADIESKSFEPFIRPEKLGVGAERFAREVQIIASSTLQATVPRAQYPVFVTFGDLKDSNSVVEVDPANLAAVFGPGYRLAGITVRTTTSTPSHRIRSILTWLSDYPEPRLDTIFRGTFTPDKLTIAQRLSHGDFVRH